MTFDPKEARDAVGRWTRLGGDDVKDTYHVPIADAEKLADQERLANTRGSRASSELAGLIRKNGFDRNRALTVDTYRDGGMGLGDGFHRLTAAREAGLTHVPVNVYKNTSAGQLAATKAVIHDEETALRSGQRHALSQAEHDVFADRVREMCRSAGLVLP
jgi:hypothetical protein